MSRATIEALYSAFARLDDAAMGRCYADEAKFDDEAFSLAGGDRVRAMWSMLCEATRAKGRDVWRLEYSKVTDNSAHWEAHYRFSATGRMVHNIIESRFEFDAAGLIRRQLDRFDFWRWSRQALGTPGLLLGWTPMLRNKVRAQAARNLDAFIARKR